jgi:hypothetical protein
MCEAFSPFLLKQIQFQLMKEKSTCKLDSQMHFKQFDDIKSSMILFLLATPQFGMK